MTKEVREIIAVALRREPLDIRGLAKLLLAQVRMAETETTKRTAQRPPEEAAS